MNKIEEIILAKIKKELNPSLIEIEDESYLHANHNPSAKEGGTHFKIKIVSKKFKGKSRIEKHRIVNTILKNEFKNGLHALTLSLSDIE
ncbi:MAG: BolA family protein [Pseudomonadota bacterium]|nr:BolA family protein [Pseudomonadota bacterium]|tara:strand:+ start:2458 stop:2724 length:267 start_codon:yes stop_codon:yes gene_type:complete